MIGIFLTQSTTPIIGWVAKLLGFIMEGIFNLLYLMKIPSIGLAIILFTIVIYCLMLPLTIKQQKFSKLSAKMNPEIQAIQAKYKNRRDNDAMMAMNEETQEVYAKYGVSPTGSCVQLLIQMPILFALYKVIYAIPAYVGKIKDTFLVLVNKIIVSEKGLEYLNNSIAYAKDPKGSADLENFLTGIQTAGMYSKQFKTEEFAAGVEKIEQFVNSNNMAGLETALNDGSLSSVQNTVIDVLNKASASELHTMADKFDVATLQQNGQYIIDQLSANGEVIERGLLETYNNFLGINIANSPSVMVKEAIADHAWLLLAAAIAIPVLSALTQWLNVKLMPQAGSNGQNAQENTMNSTMKTMNMFMPIMSAFFCYTLPSGLGLYWIAGSIIRSIQQVLINKHMDKMDMDQLIAKNKKKSAKKMAKIKEKNARINAYANMNTKNINNGSTAPQAQPKKRTMSEKAMVSSNEREELVKNSKKTKTESSGAAGKGSIASKANLVKEYNERNNK